MAMLICGTERRPSTERAIARSQYLTSAAMPSNGTTAGLVGGTTAPETVPMKLNGPLKKKRVKLVGPPMKSTRRPPTAMAHSSALLKVTENSSAVASAVNETMDRTVWL